jgi:hypothetical protein
MVKERDKNYKTKDQLLSALDSGYFGVGKFISLQEDQREDLLRIIDLLSSYFKKQKVERPLNIFIQAPPGVGKTFLVKQLCFTLEDTLKEKIRYYNFNLSYMASPDDILNAFRKIQSSNINNEGPVVFFDEVDAGLGEKKDAYRFFLTPMFEGKIYDKGDELNIGKAVLFFAASKGLERLLEIKEAENENQSYKEWIAAKKQIFDDLTEYSDREDKIVDFLDRIDEYIFLPPSTILFGDNAVLSDEQAGLLVTALILKHFPNIVCVEDEVIALLAKCLNSITSRRKVDSIIFKSTQSPDGKFRSENLPPSFFDEYDDIIKEYEEIKKRMQSKTT